MRHFLLKINILMNIHKIKKKINLELNLNFKIKIPKFFF